MNDKFNDSLASLLEEGRINYAIRKLLAKCNASVDAHPDLRRVISALESVRETYSLLRNFLIQGKPDPDREKVYESLKGSIKSLARDYLFIVNENRLDSFFSEYRMQKVRGVTLPQLLDDLRKADYRIAMAAETEADSIPFIRKREDVVDALFRRIWTLPPWASGELNTLESLLEDQTLSSDYILMSQVISALLLGSLKFNDPSKFLLLLKAYDSFTDERLAARALTAIVLVIGRWGYSALSTPSVKEAVQNLEDSILTYSRIRDVVMTLIRTRDTDRVSREIADAFNATMKEMSPELLDKLQREGLAVDDADTGMNPEWEKLMKNKDFEDRMKAINDMQLEGMDVMMQTFSRLKTFPFFRQISNWFLPFSTSHSQVASLFESFNEKGFTTMADATEMCAGDRFSFSLGILQMPEDKRNMLAMTVGAQLEAMEDMIKDRGNVKRGSLFAREALLFARDLYRFAKLFPKNRDFHDPFSQPIDFLKLPLLGSLLSGDDLIITSADFYFQHGYYELALTLYEEAARSGKADRQLYEKIGFCRQSCSDIAGAVDSYEKADLFSSDADKASIWLLNKLAFCNKALGHYDRSIDYYRRILEARPEDLNTEFHLATVLLRAGQIEEAKALVSKVCYLDPDHKHATRIHNRLKAHEAYTSGKLQEALGLYEEARGNQPAHQYVKDLTVELKQLNPGADVNTLRILLDTED